MVNDPSTIFMNSLDYTKRKSINYWICSKRNKTLTQSNKQTHHIEEEGMSKETLIGKKVKAT